MNRVHAWHTFTAGHSITADAVAFAMGEGVEKKGEGKGETEEEEEETNPSTVCRGGHKFYRDDRAQAAGEVDPLVAMGVGLLEKGFAPA